MDINTSNVKPIELFNSNNDIIKSIVDLINTNNDIIKPIAELINTNNDIIKPIAELINTNNDILKSVVQLINTNMELQKESLFKNRILNDLVNTATNIPIKNYEHKNDNIIEDCEHKNDNIIEDCEHKNDNIIEDCEHKNDNIIEDCEHKNDNIIEDCEHKNDNIIEDVQNLKKLVPVLKKYNQDEIKDIEDFCSKANILVTATQYPGCGGSATNAYNIIKYLRNQKFNVVGVFFEPIDKFGVDCYDPENLGNIFRCPRLGYYQRKYNANFISRDIKSYTNIINKCFGNKHPDIILCKNYISPIESSILYPNAPQLYLVSGSKNLTTLKLSYNELFKYDKEKFIEKTKCDDEINANNITTGIVPNSMLSYKVYQYIYPEVKDKILGPLNTSSFSKVDVPHINYDDRKYDIIFVISNFDRPIKNGSLASKILSSKKLKKYNKVIIGDNYNKYFNDVENITYFSALPNKTVIETMRNSKLLLIPSVFDASPNTPVEAMSCDCNVLSTLNVGNTEMYNDIYLLETITDENVWIDRIDKILQIPSYSRVSQLKSEDTELKYRFIDIMRSAISTRN